MSNEKEFVYVDFKYDSNRHHRLYSAFKTLRESYNRPFAYKMLMTITENEILQKNYVLEESLVFSRGVNNRTSEKNIKRFRYTLRKKEFPTLFDFWCDINSGFKGQLFTIFIEMSLPRLSGPDGPCIQDFQSPSSQSSAKHDNDTSSAGHYGRWSNSENSGADGISSIEEDLNYLVDELDVTRGTILNGLEDDDTDGEVDD